MLEILYYHLYKVKPCHAIRYLRGINTLSVEETLSIWFYLPSDKESTLKEKHFLPSQSAFYVNLYRAVIGPSG